MTRLNAPSPTSDTNQHRSLRQPTSSVKYPDKLLISKKSDDSEIQMNDENIIFVCYDLPFESNSNLFNHLQSITNDNIKTFTDSFLCLNWIKSSNNSIFFISSSINKDLISSLHHCKNVEGIFIINSQLKINKNDFPKLVGVFNQYEELFMAMENMITSFKQSKVEMFTFEDEKTFIWSQLWKEQRNNIKITSNKSELINMAQNFYRDNTKMLKFIQIFNESYQSNDVFSWCLRSPFPSRSLNNALRSHNNEQLHFYSFLFNDISRLLNQQPKRNSVIQLYRGMKLSNEILEKFEKHTGKLICANGFLTCIKSRTEAMTLANSFSPECSHMSSVLFKIDCDPSISFFELSTDENSVEIIFDVYTTFKIICVNRDQMSIIKLKIANEEGRQMAEEYKRKHNENNIQILLEELLVPSKSSTPPPTPVELSCLKVSSDEIQAEEHFARGEFDSAVAAYRRIKPVLPRILNLIGQIYREKLHNNESALVCHIQALKMQGEKGEDTSDTLTNLAIIYHNRRQFDLALTYHSRALIIREGIHPPNSLLIANNLRGIANALYAQHQLPQALENAQRALNIYESLEPINEKNVALTLSILANISHDSQDHHRAIQLGTRALVLLERCVPNNSFMLAALYHNLAEFQFSLGSLDEARNNYDKALNICKVLPPEHPKRISLENDIQRIILMQSKAIDDE